MFYALSAVIFTFFGLLVARIAGWLAFFVVCQFPLNDGARDVFVFLSRLEWPNVVLQRVSFLERRERFTALRNGQKQLLNGSCADLDLADLWAGTSEIGALRPYPTG